MIALVVFAAINRSSTFAEAPDDRQADNRPSSRSTDARIAFLQAAVRSPREARKPYTQLGLAYLQKVRETSDPSFYSRAEDALQRAIKADDKDADAVVGLANVALARHDFRRGLRFARRARALQPTAVNAYPPLVDALVELGRYDDAGRALQQFIDRKPGLPAYARVSYFRELHGDLDGAVEAMELAISTASGVPEASASVQALLGNLQFARGRMQASRRSYRAALAAFPGHAPAEAGLARLDAADGRLDAASRRLQKLVERLPLPEYVVALGEVQLAAGQPRRAREQFELVRVQQKLVSAGGVNTDVEVALFEADHGNADRAVALARRAWRAAPSVRSADALGWALTRAGRPQAGMRFAERAIRLGWRDPHVLFHAGMAAAAAGSDMRARRLLRSSLALNPRFSPLYAPRARQALKELR
ncbi:MAG: tetratricopeptide repeat protein [Actinomycetota bacterium]|nr:tetratricopeptide repeat protein [Actinomycetota bacterium]